MPDSNVQPEAVPDDVPVADAVEQRLSTADQVSDEDTTLATPLSDLPLEAAAPDWQEQLETVDFDTDLDEFDRDS